MGYRVKAPEGELRFEHLSEVGRAMRQGLVDPEDEVVEDGKETGVRAGEHPTLKGYVLPPSKAASEHRLRVLLACGLGLAALIVWEHSGWSLPVRAVFVMVDGIVLTMVLSQLVQNTSRFKRR